MTRKRKITNPFVSIKASGLLLPVDLLVRVRDRDKDIPGLESSDYNLSGGQKPQEAAAAAWNNCQAAWKEFRRKLAALPDSDAGTSLTRDEWLLPLFKELGYGQLQTKRKLNFDEREYPVSHGWEDHVPIHLLSARFDLDKRTPGVAGAARQSPYSLVQELLNRSATHRWGFVSNGLKLYVLRDNISLARASNLLFDLEAMMEGNAYWDFVVLYMVCHQSRVEILDEETQDEDGDNESTPNPENCWLERWAKLADEQGVQARETMRIGVEAAINSLGAGFLSTKGNAELRRRMGDSGDEFDKQKYYHQLLRIIYRLIMLFVAEEKKNEDGSNMFHPLGTPADVSEKYHRFYSVSRLRKLALRRGTSHGDVYESLKILFEKLRDGYEPLGIPGFGSLLFSADATPELDNARISNEALLDAVRHLCYTDDKDSRRPVDFGNLGAEELGSVYESLLELHPIIDSDSGPFKLGTAAGSERKTTGSYYTPTSLVNCLLDSALDPVIEQAKEADDAEAALLDLKVCDPACGSGHFLIAAAERIATDLARLRTGDDQPSTLMIQHAKRDVIGRCIYGVDMNPLAVELCKVSLWMEALDPGRPLSFLSHHIRCGNSLLGTTPRLLANGIPDNAFKAIEGDDKKIAADLKKDNKRERKEMADQMGSQGILFGGETFFKLGNLPANFARLSSGDDKSVADVAEKERQYAELVKGTDYLNARLLADTWCAAFVWKKDQSDLGKLCPTERDFRKIESNPHSILPHVKSEVRRLAGASKDGGYQFFHWHLAFPDVFALPEEAGKAENELTGWSRGFDVVLGNPPWEMVEVSEKEFFAQIRPDISNATTAKLRAKMILQLAIDDPNLLERFKDRKREVVGSRHLIQNSEKSPRSAVGRINSYPLFVELSALAIQESGRVGMIVPSAVAMDAYNAKLFGWFCDENRLVSLFDFENRDAIFSGVHRSYRFCLLTISSKSDVDAIDLCFFAHSTAELSNPDRRISLSTSDLLRFSPNTLAPPMLLNAKDGQLASLVYRRTGVLRPKNDTVNRWPVAINRMLSLSDKGDIFGHSSELSLPCSDEWKRLYTGKAIHQYTHRYATWQIDEWSISETNDVTNPDFSISTEYFARVNEVQKRTRGKLPERWRIGYRDVCRATDERTSIAAIIPPVGCDTHCRNVYFEEIHGNLPLCLVANFNSFVLDYFCRQKVVSIGLGAGIVEQLPFLPTHVFSQASILNSPGSVESFVARPVLELTYTAWELEAFALDSGYEGPPFRWDEERRFLLRCELDAAFFHLYLGPKTLWGRVLDSPDETVKQKSISKDANESIAESSTPYGVRAARARTTNEVGQLAITNPELVSMFPTPRHAVEYIMDSFPIVKRKDIKDHGDYRTKLVILDIYDKMQAAIDSGQPYQTQLDPPPGPPTDADGNFIPMAEWDTNNWPSHIHQPREAEVK